jgi:tRNA dimethylallyltransferase
LSPSAMSPKRIVALVGPTGVGKSSLALRLAPALNAEIVSADSVQIYRGMDIGTGKPTTRERREVAHHLIDCVAPDEPFHAAHYQKRADRAIEDVSGRGKTVMVVGGTGLYVKVLLHGLFEDSRAERFSNWKEKLIYYESFGEDPHRILKEMDPEAAGTIHPNDRVRAQRALEVMLRTGKSIIDLRKLHGFRQHRYEALVIGLTMDRERLFERIDARVDGMVRQGLLEEVRSLISKGYSPDLPSMQALGYRHMAGVLAGDVGMPEAVRMLKRDTRRYAKRQYTWFRHQQKVSWFEAPFPLERILETIRAFLEGM